MDQTQKGANDSFAPPPPNQKVIPTLKYAVIGGFFEIAFRKPQEFTIFRAK